MAAIEATLGEDRRGSVTEFLAIRTSRILSHADVDGAFRALYNFRSNLVHGNEARPTKEVI